MRPGTVHQAVEAMRRALPAGVALDHWTSRDCLTVTLHSGDHAKQFHVPFGVIHECGSGARLLAACRPMLDAALHDLALARGLAAMRLSSQAVGERVHAAPRPGREPPAAARALRAAAGVRHAPPRAACAAPRGGPGGVVSVAFWPPVPAPTLPPPTSRDIPRRPLHALHPALVEALQRSFRQGLSVREVAARHLVAKRVANRYRPAHLPPCACGQPAGHRGWCRVRYARHPRRQAALQALHARQKERPACP